MVKERKKQKQKLVNKKRRLRIDTLSHSETVPEDEVNVNKQDSIHAEG